MPPVDVNKIHVSTDNSQFREVKIAGHVGFDSLPDQLVTKSVQQGFTFNIMCIGETGLGKSTLMDSLFNTEFGGSPSPHDLTAVKLKSNTYELQESNVKLKLTLCDTAGYGDQINKDDSFDAIVNYIDAQFENYLQEELKIRRSLCTYHDARIHACLYFICPSGHGLKSLDLVCMRKLQNKVNIIPVIAMADTICKSELVKFKERILSSLASNGVQIYQFPVDDPDVAENNQLMNASLPFAVVGSSQFVKVGSKMVRAREYPWGTVQVENEHHCDFVKLREMLIRTNMEDLRDTTHSKHYELFRRGRLEKMGFSDVGPDNEPTNFQRNYETKRSEHVVQMQAKEEEMRQMFVKRVKEKENELKESEKSLQQRFESMKKKHLDEKRRQDEEWRVVDEEIAEFQRLKTQHMNSMTTGKRRAK